MEDCAVLRFSGRAALAFGWERPLGRFFFHYPPAHPMITVDARFGRAARTLRTTRPLNLNLIRRGSRGVEQQ
jgi:hypothetical protein